MKGSYIYTENQMEDLLFRQHEHHQQKHAFLSLSLALFLLYAQVDHVCQTHDFHGAEMRVHNVNTMRPCSIKLLNHKRKRILLWKNKS